MGNYSKPKNKRNNNSGNNDSSKRSWAVYGTIKKGQFQGAPFVCGFNISRDGLIRISVMPYKGTHESKSKNGNLFLTMMAEITVGKQKPYAVPCLYNKTNKKVVIKELGFVISPNGSGHLANGRRVTGYCGRNYSS